MVAKLWINTRINSDRALLGGGVHVIGYSDGTVGWTRGCSMFSQDVLPKSIYQLNLSEDYNSRILPFFQDTGYQNQ